MPRKRKKLLNLEEAQAQLIENLSLKTGKTQSQIFRELIAKGLKQ